jgi:hypothetical protein
MQFAKSADSRSDSNAATHGGIAAYGGTQDRGAQTVWPGRWPELIRKKSDAAPLVTRGRVGRVRGGLPTYCHRPLDRSGLGLARIGSGRWR